MEFLDIELTKDLSLLLHAIHSPFYRRILKETILLSDLKNLYKKIRETRKLEYIHEQHLVERKNAGRKPNKNSSHRRLKFMPRTSTKNAIQEFHLRTIFEGDRCIGLFLGKVKVSEATVNNVRE
jgi:hypothetical protein